MNPHHACSSCFTSVRDAWYALQCPTTLAYTEMKTTTGIESGNQTRIGTLATNQPTVSQA